MESDAGDQWSNLAARHKTTIGVWRKGPFPEAVHSSPPEPTLFELAFKTGALLPGGVRRNDSRHP